MLPVSDDCGGGGEKTLHVSSFERSGEFVSRSEWLVNMEGNHDYSIVYPWYVDVTRFCFPLKFLSD